jgi:response regulator RpfG family c-di-GMP phosphodiesterase
MSDYKHTVLCVDDEENILHALSRVFRKEGCRLITAADGACGLKLLEQNKDVQLVISDQRMPGMSGTEFLAIVRERYPEIIRIVLTGYTEVDAITDAINKGHIYKFILKPWNDQNLVLDIRQCLDQYDLRKANSDLHMKILQQNEELKTINENLESIVKERTEELNLKNRVLELSRAILEDIPWPVVGISSELIIVMINISAQSMLINNRTIELGKRISNYFSADVIDRIRYVIDYNRSDELCGYKLSGKDYNLALAPSSGGGRGKGAVMALTPV